MAMSRFDGCSSLTRWPAMRISPSVTVSRPAIVLSRVVFPQPDGPTSTRKPPLSRVMSMPLRISNAPKRFLRPMISRNATGSSFHRARHQATHAVAAGDHVDAQRVQRDRHRRRLAGSERGPEQKIVPDVGELKDHRDHDYWPG